MFQSYVLINFTHDLLYFSSISIVPDINYFQLSNLEISILQNCNVYENEISISIDLDTENEKKNREYIWQPIWLIGFIRIVLGFAIVLIIHRNLLTCNILHNLYITQNNYYIIQFLLDWFIICYIYISTTSTH